MQKTNPERYWELYHWILKEKLVEIEKAEKMRADIENKKKGYSNEKVSGSISEGGLNQNKDDNFYSEIIKAEDIKNGKSKIPG